MLDFRFWIGVTRAVGLDYKFIIQNDCQVKISTVEK